MGQKLEEGRQANISFVYHSEWTLLSPFTSNISFADLLYKENFKFCEISRSSEYFNIFDNNNEKTKRQTILSIIFFCAS